MWRCKMSLIRNFIIGFFVIFLFFLPERCRAEKEIFAHITAVAPGIWGMQNYGLHYRVDRWDFSVQQGYGSIMVGAVYMMPFTAISWPKTKLAMGLAYPSFLAVGPVFWLYDSGRFGIRFDNLVYVAPFATIGHFVSTLYNIGITFKL